jgi:hypothetical protein
MTQPCPAQNPCRSRINDWKLNCLPRSATRSAWPRTIGPAASRRARGDIGTADPASNKILGTDGRVWRHRAATRQLAREPVQPSIADPGGDNDENKYDQLGNSEHC